MTDVTKDGFHTRAIHAGEPQPKPNGSVVAPIYQSVTYESVSGKPEGARYTRLSNTPNHELLAAKLAALEGAEAAMVTASGMAAISTALLALVDKGGHVVAQDNLYGGTYQFFRHDYEALGREVSFFALDRPETLEKQFKPNTRVVYIEAISNPLMRVPDLHGILRLAKSRGCLVFIDNTFPSPVNFNPIAMGFDLVLHSATKYLNGHTDVLAGAVAGRRAHVEKIGKLLEHLGGSLDPHSCYLLNRGIKTLGVRVKWQNDSAMKLASALEKHPNVRQVRYPGLPSHPDHARAKEIFRGFGGMLAFEYAGTAEAADQALRKLRLAAVAPSLGGVETLVTRPVTTSHSFLSVDDRRLVGIADSLVRVSVGLEDPEDLIRDFTDALN